MQEILEAEPAGHISLSREVTKPSVVESGRIGQLVDGHVTWAWLLPKALCEGGDPAL